MRNLFFILSSIIIGLLLSYQISAVSGQAQLPTPDPPPLPQFDNLFHLPVVASSNLPEPTSTPVPPTETPTATNTPTITPTITLTPSATPSSPVYDLARYIQGDGRLYEVHLLAASFDTQARHQTQFEGTNHFFHTKGELNSEWEELWYDQDHIYRGTDTSPGSGQFYTLYESITDYLLGNPGSKWIAREMAVGQAFFRRPYVVFRNKADCSLVIGGYYDDSYIKVRDFYPTYTFQRTGITVHNVVELAWLPGNDPDKAVDEVYFYAEGFGLVGWTKTSNGWNSAISEIHNGGLPNNTREAIPCLADIHNRPQLWSPKLNLGLLPESYARLVRP